MLKQLVDKYTGQFEASKFAGKPITELSNEELMAVVCFMGDQINEKRDEHLGALRFMRSIVRGR